MGQRRGLKWAALGGADWTGYGWLAEEDTKRRKTEEKKEERGEGDIGSGGETTAERKRRTERDFGSRGKTEEEGERKRKTY